MEVRGSVHVRDGGAAVAGVLVRAWPPGVHPNEQAPDGEAKTTSTGAFAMTLPGEGDEVNETGEFVFRLFLGERRIGVVQLFLVARGRFDRISGEILPGIAPAFLLVTDPFGETGRLFGRAITESGSELVGQKIEATDPDEGMDPRFAEIGAGGWFELLVPRVERLRLTVLSGEPLRSELKPEWSETVDAEHEITFSPPPMLRIAGHLREKGTAQPLAGLDVEIRDRTLVYPNPLGQAQTAADGGFEVSFAQVNGLPEPSFQVARLGQPVATVELAPAFDATGLMKAELEVDALPDVFRLHGEALERTNRRGVAGLRVEAWDLEMTTMTHATATDLGGRFELTFAADGEGTAPAFRLRLLRDTIVAAQPPPPVITWSPAGEGTLFVEVDAPPEAPKVFRIRGRLLDEASRTGLAGLRIEAWDRSPRDGGFVGVAADTAVDGAFEIIFPAPPPVAAPAPPPRLPTSLGPLELRPRPLLSAPTPITPAPAPVDRPPDLFFRLYQGDRLLRTVNANVSWGPEGIGVTVLEIAAPGTDSSQEVGLHEIGESIASTVDRVQTELARYPSSMGAYLLDEIDLRVPVEMRIDELGQVRTKVIDSAAAAGPQAGQIHLRIRPLIGASQRLADVPDQPLTALEELDAEAIAKLAGQRIYSVEDLARVAMTGAGRAALEALDLGVDLNALLGKAALLAFRDLPRPVREALVKLGVPDLGAFAHDTDPGGLAAEITALLGQEFVQAEVEAWQKRVREALAVPRPTIEPSEDGDNP